MGVRFRNGWAVVERGSKIYHRLRMLPMLKSPKEQPLSFLKQLPFITRSMDVKLIYGADVYAKYVTLDLKEQKLAEETKIVEEEKAHLDSETNCKFRLDTGSFCKHEVRNPEITSYCPTHITKDPRLAQTTFRMPVASSTKEKRKLRKTAFNKLKELKKTEEKLNVSVVEEETPGTQEQVRGET